ncbi:GNAT family N-acetyltransferase [Algibacter sp. PT7-4]|uniref:GNAT family N-acetyltransferase n=1 Tax=Algibacter ulvanivorans TaxID=3400999 RepID=UPI003AAAC1BC
MTIVYQNVVSDQDLVQILELQKRNSPTSISVTEKQTEGFVTVKHNIELLKQMNTKCPHIIAKNNNKVIGYALSMVKAFKNDISVLKPMFTEIEKNITNTLKYIVMGQICIDKAYRKKGVFRGLYAYMQQQLNKEYDAIITEVDTKNLRSLNAHKAVGFKTLTTYISNNQEWAVIIWKWK